jgi:hypothetical protein
MAMHKDKVIYLLVRSDKSWGFGTIKITGMKKGDREEYGTGEHPVGEMFICPKVSTIFQFLLYFYLLFNVLVVLLL